MTVETAEETLADPRTLDEALLPRTLDEALAVLQGRLPRIPKTETAKVEHRDGGRHEYSYADLAAVSHAAMPVMSQLGLSFTAAPTLKWNDEHPEIAPKFVLAYALRHTSGDSIEGHYPLPSGVSPQAMGSAITYARRYTLCAVTGLAPEDDDDAAAAEAGLRRQAQETPPPRQDSQGGGGKLRSAPQREQKQEQKPEPDRPASPAQALADLAVKLTETKGKTVDDLRTQVYKLAESRRMLRAQVTDPVTGEKSQLTAVISRAKARMEALAADEETRS